MTVSIDNLTRHWANSAQTLVGMGLNVIDTGHAAGSRVFVLKVNGNTIFDVDAAGTVTGNITVVGANTDPRPAFARANAAYDLANSAYIKANSINVSGSTSSGAPAYSITEPTTDYVVTANDYIVNCIMNSNTMNVFLPNTQIVGNTKMYVIKHSGGYGNTVNVIPNVATQMVDGNPFFILSQRDSITIYSNSTAWIII
jgi:hypothetical protein